jgi:hypothetical protein
MPQRRTESEAIIDFNFHLKAARFFLEAKLFRQDLAEPEPTGPRASAFREMEPACHRFRRRMAAPQMLYGLVSRNLRRSDRDSLKIRCISA